MEIRNAKRWGKAGFEPYVVGLLGLLAATAIQFAFQPIFGDHLSMLFYAINCAAIAFRYGFWPSFATLLLSIPVAFFFFVKPYGAFDGIAENDVFKLVLYGTWIVSTAILIEWVRREQYRATLLTRVSDTRYRLLVEADEDRRAMLKDSVV